MIAQQEVGQRPVGVGVGILGIKPDGVAKVRHGLVKLTQLKERRAPIVVGLAVLGVQPKSLETEPAANPNNLPVPPLRP